MEPIPDNVKQSMNQVSKHVCSLSDITCCSFTTLGAAYRHERAMRMKAEFYRDHHNDKTYCHECSSLDRDPCHDLTDADWEAAVDEELASK